MASSTSPWTRNVSSLPSTQARAKRSGSIGRMKARGSTALHLIALNAKTGAPVPTFGTNGIVDMMKDLDIDYKGDPNGKIGNSSPVVISNDVIVVGPAHLRPVKANVKGDVLAYDVRTGKKKWI